MKPILLIILLVIIFTGCAALRETMKEIGTNPEEYATEVTQLAKTTNAVVPELPYIFCLGIGYAVAFARRWYQNIKREQAKNALTKSQ